MTQYLDEYEQRVSEAVDSLWDALVDPREAYLDDEGMWWNSPFPTSYRSRFHRHAFMPPYP